jgi:predicted Rossmann-fold nucleotide-binding protein
MNKIDMNKIRTVCVYCGSGPGTNPHFTESAVALGRIFAENGIRLVYGGGSLGLMGAIATSVLACRRWWSRPTCTSASG